MVPRHRCTHLDIVPHGCSNPVPKIRHWITSRLLTSHPRRTRHPKFPIHDIFKGWVIGYPFVQVNGCFCFASPSLDCPIYIRHAKGSPWRVEGSSGREDWPFVQPCEIERKFGKIYKTAWSEHMAYMVYQTVVVADLMIHKYSFTVDRRGRATYPRRNELAMHNIKVTIEMFQTKIDVINFASTSRDNICICLAHERQVCTLTCNLRA
jgi:hypothetical protein